MENEKNITTDLNNEVAEEVVTKVVGSSDLEKSLTPKLPVFKQLAVLAVFLFGVFSVGAFSVWLGNDNRLPSDHTAAVGDSATDSIQPTEEYKQTFAELDLLARSAIVIDVRDARVLYEKSADEIWPLASITKLMTALVASEIVEEGMVIPVTAAAVEQDGDSGLAAGENFSYKKLSDLLLMTSSNDGAYALSAAAGGALDSTAPDAAFVKAMNVRAKELGFNSTYFRNPTGLDITEDEAGAYGTAREVAGLMEYLLKNHPELLEATTESNKVVYNEAGGPHQALNTNRMVDAIPTAIASKTGYTTLSGGNLVVAFDAGVNHPVVAVVLGSTHQGRFSDILQLVEASRYELQNSD